MQCLSAEHMGECVKMGKMLVQFRLPSNINPIQKGVPIRKTRPHIHMKFVGSRKIRSNSCQVWRGGGVGAFRMGHTEMMEGRNLHGEGRKKSIVAKRDPKKLEHELILLGPPVVYFSRGTLPKKRSKRAPIAGGPRFPELAVKSGLHFVSMLHSPGRTSQTPRLKELMRCFETRLRPGCPEPICLLLLILLE